ncbi:MAG: hypothetical protein VX438_17265, partial [Planctomycetota bacterium]|nr:hypothetical protein [Planctomycetota bacterium]
MTLSRRSNAVSQVETELQHFRSIDTAMELGDPVAFNVQATEDSGQARSRKRLDLRNGEFQKNLTTEGKVFRVDAPHCNFQPCDLLSEPQIHLSIKTEIPSERIDVERLMDH